MSDADLFAAGAKRVERIGDAVLVLGDCREIAPKLPRPAALISDPPYGIGYVRGATGKQGAYSRNLDPNRNTGPIIGDNAPFDPAKWLAAADAVLMWGANHYAQQLPHGRWMAWNKLGGMEPWDSFCDVEFAWHNKRGADRIFSHLWKGLCQAGAGEKRDHPTQKPVALMRWCIEQAKVPSGGLILDPYMGSGTTLVAAVQMGHPCIGIELDPTHFDTACRRVAEAARQPSLFVPAPAKVEQASFSYPPHSEVYP